MTRSTCLLILTSLLAVQCQSSALETLSFPKGVVFPAMPKKPNMLKSSMNQKSKKKGFSDHRITPPRRMVEKKEATPVNLMVMIKKNPKIEKTEHIAVMLKNNGYRLYKKRTLSHEKNWMYWIKTKEGAPLFKVELVWQDKQHRVGELNLWSWDDKEQMNLNGRDNLINIFGKRI